MTALNNDWNTLTFANEKEAAIGCAKRLAQLIDNTLARQATASLFVSGGKSPAAVFDCLSREHLSWNKTRILLVDERWAPNNPADQNQTLVREHLLQQHASSATFQPLLLTQDIQSTLCACNEKVSALSSPDVVLLGMGLDGHTASLFPDAADYSAAMQSQAHYVLVHPALAPYPRLSMSYHWLKQAGSIVLFIPGAQKWKAFEHFIVEQRDVSPLQQLLHDVGSRVTVITTRGDAP